ncbi:LIP1 [Cyberlindnera jadinii]|uniref:Ceramide synthase accessory subunit n=1 Tax=Cyberlindnera jadinii (strain ATCC 18201 / CBS 1600 / BCRC 20928 / JCM 3617 / NBRC 0987 / NRRL Y-1542) TaxID=983966 RepID=A0A0H5C9P2_CYBJN|nr:ceramide synthase accessory subunit [Cyberlindnera jadinii NRRL Y-1542]ODV72468.1 ceramide synthase accessory subunit [Cyberlindnera jadinii NRRL Y-1542]CEP24777.1 LIP1 [Cyberlindnera jadinii]
MAANKVFTLLQVTFIVLALIAGVEYFKYSTMVNYEWFHCTPQLTLIPGTGITKAIAVGGPSCDKRGQLKSITKRLTRTFDPNLEPLAFCLAQEGNKVVGYVSNVDQLETLEQFCPNVILWDDVFDAIAD